jgi:hypothetical protein
MIYPVHRQCQSSPFYPDDGVLLDFMAEVDSLDGTRLETRGYAWNYYHIYQCCMNEQGQLVATLNLPQPICFDMPSGIMP